MEYDLPGRFPAHCCDSINRIAAFQLHIADAYLSMVCHYNAEDRLPALALYFNDHAERKRENAKRFLRFLRRHECRVLLPFLKRPDQWVTGMNALTYALELEKELYDMLQDLRSTTSLIGEDELFDFLQMFVDEQRKNITFLEHELARSNSETPAVTFGEHSESQCEQHNP
ncbi:ferritin, heavy subunit-like [Ochotona curzoniae]|uniref:ferritin, heavy subunit-like n=1 Tax=Ochotona curzoniae TaxID=130825 RepID=UPI001B34A37E|nr:ferritin, heavy subunit-like [Ochotona curzoniae]